MNRTEQNNRPGTGHPARRGMSLIELMVVLVIVGVLLAASVPSFRRSIEQSHADIAGANLRAIWTAQRLYWLENRTFCSDLSTLETDGLIDPTILAASIPYTYPASITADDSTFTVSAVRSGSTVWSGGFEITETGEITGSVSDSGVTTITPGFMD